ncbi:MAG: NAD(P)-binding domain-containing protein [Chloroflexi bacterium]|nr:NAD(P)-binding domain-containing protein [Chloroflexota bacterium]
MRIGIIGAGKIGGTLGLSWARAGHEVMFSSRHPENLLDLVGQAGGNGLAGTVPEACEHAELLVLAVPYDHLDDALNRMGDLGDRLVIDATNPYRFVPGEGMHRLIPEDTSAGMLLHQRLPGTHLFKVFSSIPARWLTQHAFQEPDWMAAPYCTISQPLISTIENIINDTGFEPVLVGSFQQCQRIELFGEFSNKPLTAAEVHEQLGH